MPDKENSGGGMGEAFLVIGCVVFLVVWWFIQGEPNKQALSHLFVQAPTGIFGTSTGVNTIPLGTALAPSTVPSSASSYDSFPNAPQITNLPKSPEAHTVSIESYTGAKGTTPAREYLVLYASPTNAGPITVSGWQVKSLVSGQSAAIGGAVTTPQLSSMMTTGALALLPGQSAVVTTGRSPIGVSFLENECMGYLSQFQQFTPPLSLSCPFPSQELSVYTNPALAQDPSCTAAVNALAPCQALLGAPSGVSGMCSAFMTEHFTYNGCVATHQSDSNFYGREWRIYLGRDQQLWNDQSDIIGLFDQNGKLVSAVVY